jgi:hypothetical protein
MHTLAFIQAHWGLLFAVIGTHEAHQFGSAVFITMPAPGSPFTFGTLYAWFYDAAHQYANLRAKERP